MKFKRILATAFALALTLPLLAVSAHPGRTDSGGGHTDSDTGDYHYHHGYPGHEHYDIDNNGQIDCPYDFDDKTGESSGQPSGGSFRDNRYPGSNQSGTLSSNATHKTISRLNPIEEPSSNQENNESDDSTIDFYITVTTHVLGAVMSGIVTVITMHNYRRKYITGVIAGIALAAFFAFTSYILSWPCILIAYALTKRFYAWSDARKARKEQEHKTQLQLEKARQKLYKAPAVLPNNTRAPSSNTQSNPKHPEPPKVIVSTPFSEQDHSLPPQTFAKPDPDVDFRPVILPESEVSAHTRCRDTCRYLWYETLMLRNCTKPLISSDATVYIWTALFYTAVKTLRSQSSVNRIYSYFSETTSEFVTEAQYTDLVVAKVREVYRVLREPLNDSGIDPRTAKGRRDLWRFLEDHSKELNLRPDLAYEFLCASQRVCEMIKDVFPQAQPYPKAGDIRYSIDDLPSA